MKRRLALKREHLSELTPTDLVSVAGGTTTDLFTGYYPSINAPCLSERVCVELAPIPTRNSPCPTLNGCFTGTTAHTFTGC